MRTIRTLLVPALIFALLAAFAGAAPLAAQDPLVVSLVDALADAGPDGRTVVDGSGVAPYQYPDDTGVPARFVGGAGEVGEAGLGLYIFDETVEVVCTDPTQLCGGGFTTPDPGEVYLGFDMTFADDVPVGGLLGQVINYSFPFIVPGDEPFVALPEFEGDTWQGMSRAVTAESTGSFFNLDFQTWDADQGNAWEVTPALSFGLVDGRRVTIFLPLGAAELSLRDTISVSALARTAIREFKAEGATFGAVDLPTAIADAISGFVWGAAVHVHSGDYGVADPSTITALPPTPRVAGSGFPPPDFLIPLGETWWLDDGPGSTADIPDGGLIEIESLPTSGTGEIIDPRLVDPGLVAPVTTTTTTTSDGGGLPWILLGGAGLALFGAGLAFALKNGKEEIAIGTDESDKK